MKLAYLLVLDVEPSGPQAAEALNMQLLPDVRHAIMDDFGPESWGGYDGPHVTDVTIIPIGVS